MAKRKAVVTLYIPHYSASATKKSFPTDTGKLLTLNEILVGAVGIEPTTFGLKGRCSTTELRP
jgi:hypothetical protein